MATGIGGGGSSCPSYWCGNNGCGGSDKRGESPKKPGNDETDNKVKHAADKAGITGNNGGGASASQQPGGGGFEPKFGDVWLPGNPNAKINYDDLPEWDPSKQQNPNVYDGCPGDKPNLEDGNRGNPNAYNG